MRPARVPLEAFPASAEYAKVVGGIAKERLAPPAMTRTISAERRDHVEKIGKDLGGGAFTKLDKI